MAEILALGAGYSVRPLLKALAAEGARVTATTRSEEKAEALREEGLSPLLWEAPAPLPPDVARKADAILISAPPREGACPALAALPGSAVKGGTRLLYLSSSGVYGDAGGAWIDETAQCSPGTERGRARLAAEAGWRDLAEGRGARLTLCRLAGIYGPGRNAVASLRGDTRGKRSGLSQRVIKPGQVFNRIHRDDIASGLRALLRAEAPPGIVNFCDDEPSPPQDVIAFAAELLGIAPPPEVPFETAALSDMARSFYAENKRLRNDRLKALPGFSLRYPSYREGLRAALTAPPLPEH